MEEQPTWELRRAQPQDALSFPGGEADQQPGHPAFSSRGLLDRIEKSVFGVTIEQAQEPLGVMLFADSPHASWPQAEKGSAASETSWTSWASKNVQGVSLTRINVLFLECFVVASDSIPAGKAGHMAQDMLRSLFATITQVDYVCLAHTSQSAALMEHLGLQDLFLPAGTDSQGNGLHICARQSVLPPIRVRQAVPQDFDDLTPIFNEQSEIISDRFGEYFLNDLIESKNPNTRSLAMEIEGKAAGFLSVSRRVDTNLLKDQYETDAFNHLTNDNGEPSVFAISLFVVSEEHETSYLHLLRAAFGEMEDCDYCIITVPHTVVEFPLLQIFSRVPARSDKVVPQELFVIHRLALTSDISLDALVPEDVGDVQRLLANSHHAEDVMADMTRFLATGADPDGGRIDCYVLKCYGACAGIIVTRACLDAESIRSHFNIEEHILYKQYNASSDFIDVCHLVINPIFENLIPFVVHEMLAATNTHCALHRIFPEDAVHANSSWSPALERFLPVRPRGPVSYPMQNLGDNGPEPSIRVLSNPFALCLMASKHIYDPKVGVNARLVIVGASDTGLSAVQDIILRSHMLFNNITLIDPVGLSAPSSPAADASVASHSASAFADSLRFDDHELTMLALDTWMDIVQGSVKTIDRKRKLVILTNGAVIPYDQLLLTPNLEYTRVGDDTETTIVAHRQDVEDLLQRAQESDGYTVMIYGGTIDVLTLAGAVASAQVARPVVVLENQLDDILRDQNAAVHARAAWLAAEVELYEKTSLSSCQRDARRDILVASVNTADGEKRIRCDEVVDMSRKLPNKDLFEALAKAFIVYDGGIVINNDFTTNDGCIRAAGEATRYARKYHADDYLHRDMAAEEVGSALASRLMELYDPLAEPTLLNDLEVARFEKPRVVRARLPADLVFFQATLPNCPEPRRVLTTGQPAAASSDEDEGNNDWTPPRYFSIDIDENGIILRITCLGEADVVRPFNYARLCGLHERTLNRIVSRYDEGLISDLYSYFDEPWAVAVMHDRFQMLFKALVSAVEDHEVRSIKPELHYTSTYLGIPPLNFSAQSRGTMRAILCSFIHAIISYRIVATDQSVDKTGLQELMAETEQVIRQRDELDASKDTEREELTTRLEKLLAQISDYFITDDTVSLSRDKLMRFIKHNDSQLSMYAQHQLK